MDNRRVDIDAYLTSKRSMPPRGPRNTLRLVFGVEVEVWTIAATVSKMAGKLYRGVLEAAEHLHG